LGSRVTPPRNVHFAKLAKAGTFAANYHWIIRVYFSVLYNTTSTLTYDGSCLVQRTLSWPGMQHSQFIPYLKFQVLAVSVFSSPISHRLTPHYQLMRKVRCHLEYLSGISTPGAPKAWRSSEIHTKGNPPGNGKQTWPPQV
jgi:hypothetical protein